MNPVLLIKLPVYHQYMGWSRSASVNRRVQQKQYDSGISRHHTDRSATKPQETVKGAEMQGKCAAIEPTQSRIQPQLEVVYNRCSSKRQPKER